MLSFSNPFLFCHCERQRSNLIRGKRSPRRYRSRACPQLPARSGLGGDWGMTMRMTVYILKNFAFLLAGKNNSSSVLTTIYKSGY